MRIISKFKDYYDCIQGMSSYDKDDILYIREKKEIALPRIELPKPRQFMWHNKSANGVFIHWDVIGFCGKLYPVFYLNTAGYVCRDKPDSSLICYTIEDIDSAVKALDPKGYDHFLQKPKRHMKDKWGALTRDDLKDFLVDFKGFEHEAIFEKHRCPTFVAYLSNPPKFFSHYKCLGQGDNLCVINERLNDFHFQKVFDPYQAFQEISMFMGNMAFPNRPIPEVSNEDLIAAKGFDKFSFRKDKKK